MTFVQKETALTNTLKGETNMLLKAKWEAKTDQKIVKRIARNRIQDIQKRHESDVVQRRAKLAALLAAEDKQYEIEFMDSLETPEQVRQKMAVRLESIKQQRDQEKQ